MRNPKRLDSFYEVLKRIHKDYFPDWRFGQLVVNFMGYYGDPFYLEEDEFLEKLGEFVDTVTKNKT